MKRQVARVETHTAVLVGQCEQEGERGTLCSFRTIQDRTLGLCVCEHKYNDYTASRFSYGVNVNLTIFYRGG